MTEKPRAILVLPEILSAATRSDFDGVPMMAEHWFLFFKSIRDVLSEIEVASRRLKVLSGAAAPTTSDIAENDFAIWHNTTSSVTQLYANIGGTLKSVALT